MVSSHGFGSKTIYSFAHLKLAFASTPFLQLNLAYDLNSPAHAAKGTPSHHKDALTSCMHIVSGNYFTPLSGYFSPFPHGTCSLSVFGEYLVLRSVFRRFQQDCTCPVVLRWHSLNNFLFRILDYHRL